MTRLPDGFAVQIDRRVKTVADGSALLGGSPARLLRLSPAARSMLDQGRLEVRDAASASLARALLDATVAHPRPAGGPSHRDVTVVIPVRDNPAGLRRLVMALRGLRVVIVDDGSAEPVAPDWLAGAPCDIEIARHARGRGPAAARNTGLARCRTEFVAFLDSDVVPRRGWLEALLGHFCDPTVALAAPRIVALRTPDGFGDGSGNGSNGSGTCGVARYEAVRSALDLGGREAPVAPYSRVPYVPSAAIVCRRSAVAAIGGFDESMHCGEDVDLCWRLLESGFRLRYEPVAKVAHQHRTRMRDWLARRAFYGSSAAPLALRHPDNCAPMAIPLLGLLACASVATGTAAGALAGVVFAGLYTRKVARTVRGAGVTASQAAGLVGRGLGYTALQLSSGVCRQYWPAALAAAAVSRRCRRAVAAAAVIDAAHDWATRGRHSDDAGPPIGPLGYLALKRLDDLAYGAGLWASALRARTLAPLRPDIRR